MSSCIFQICRAGGGNLNPELPSGMSKANSERNFLFYDKCFTVYMAGLQMVCNSSRSPWICCRQHKNCFWMGIWKFRNVFRDAVVPSSSQQQLHFQQSHSVTPTGLAPRCPLLASTKPFSRDTNNISERTHQPQQLQASFPWDYFITFFWRVIHKCQLLNTCQRNFLITN